MTVVHVLLAVVIGVGVAAGAWLLGDLAAWLTKNRYRR